MKQRVITGLLLILLLVVLLFLPGWCMALATLIAIGFATWEEYHALTLAGHRVVSWPAWVVLVGSVPLTRLLDSRALVPLMASEMAAVRPEPVTVMVCVLLPY